MGKQSFLQLERLMIQQLSNSKICADYSSMREVELGSKESVAFSV